MSIKSIQYPVIQTADTKDNKNELIIFIDKSNQVTTVPNGWQRKLINNRILYISPSQQIINNLDELSVYLKSKGTCKCGLMCPFFIQEYFSFDPSVETVENTIDQTKISCKHRKLVNNNNLINNSINIHQQSPQQQQQQQQIIEINSNLLSNIINNYESSNRVLYSINSNTSSKVSNSGGQVNKLIQIQNPISNNKTINNNSISKTTNNASNQQIQLNQSQQQNQINIQQIINLKQNEQLDTNGGQIVGYIPIRADNLGNLTNLNLLNQPIIVNSQFKTATIKNETSDSPKFLNTSVIQSPSTEIYTIHSK